MVDVPRHPDEQPRTAGRVRAGGDDPVSRIPRFRIRLGGANSFEDAVFLDAKGSLRLLGLHEPCSIWRDSERSRLSLSTPCTIAHYTGQRLTRKRAR